MKRESARVSGIRWAVVAPNVNGGKSMFEGLLQPTHLLVILVAGLFLLGPKKIPELRKGLAEGIRGFKEALNSGENPDHSGTPEV